MMEQVPEQQASPELEQDSLQRFIFEHGAVRGEVVRLSESWQAVRQRHDYPLAIRNLLGEMMAAGVMLAAMLKFDGTMIMQMQGSGAVRLLVVECQSDLTVRATAKLNADKLGEDTRLPELLGAGHFVITLDPQDPAQTAYQGIVPLSGDSVAAVLENYLLQSEQLPTRMWLAVDGNSASGLMLQRMPGNGDDELWNGAVAPAATVQPDELLQLDFATLLRRLFHEYSLQLFDPSRVRFACTCSRDKVGGMLRMLGPEEVAEALAEKAEIEVDCEFCGQSYVFDAVDAAQLFTPPEAAGPDSGGVH